MLTFKRRNPAGDPLITNETGTVIATVWASSRHAGYAPDAVAHTMAAAPDLANALRNLLYWVAQHHEPTEDANLNHLMTQAHAALMQTAAIPNPTED